MNTSQLTISSNPIVLYILLSHLINTLFGQQAKTPITSPFLEKYRIITICPTDVHQAKTTTLYLYL